MRKPLHFVGILLNCGRYVDAAIPGLPVEQSPQFFLSLRGTDSISPTKEGNSDGFGTVFVANVAAGMAKVLAIVVSFGRINWFVVVFHSGAAQPPGTPPGTAVLKIATLHHSATHPASNGLSGSDTSGAGRYTNPGPTFQCVLNRKLVSTNCLGLSTGRICKALKHGMQLQFPPTDPILETA